MEYHDYNLFHEGGHGRPRVPMKPNNPFDFWVDHLSGFEHIQQQKNQAKIATSFDTDKARSWTESETARQIDVAVRRQATTLCGVFCRGAWADGASAAGAGARARRMIEHRGAKPAPRVGERMPETPNTFPNLPEHPSQQRSAVNVPQ